jgi:hypothetical protein
MREGLGGTLDNGLISLLTVESQAVCRRAGAGLSHLATVLFQNITGIPLAMEIRKAIFSPERKFLDNKASMKA